ncbi:MAG: hypothetical protein SOR77_02905 [Peptoniphilus sp.]|uniref:hypothetical protein n=1 Tax=Peptoniphilus sp. TaxID=1971214 RepID=UPI002A75238D|nr:hypothetical protein [Peptoniphilus sp.]MDY2986567.1 hypothetical protein [Peptoniphilus sp.]
MNRYIIITIFILLIFLERYIANTSLDLRRRIYSNKKAFYKYLKDEGKVSMSSLGISIEEDIYLLDLMIENKKKDAIKFLMEEHNLSKKDALDYIYNL